MIKDLLFKNENKEWSIFEDDYIIINSSYLFVKALKLRRSTQSIAHRIKVIRGKQLGLKIVQPDKLIGLRIVRKGNKDAD